MATTDDNAGKYEAEPSTDIVEPAVKAALTGQETEITQDQINGFFSYYIQENGLTLGGASGQKAVFATRRNTGSRQPVPGVRGTGGRIWELPPRDR